MTIYRRNGSPFFYYDVVLPDGRRARKSTRATNKADAVKLAKQAKTGEAPAKPLT